MGPPPSRFILPADTYMIARAIRWNGPPRSWTARASIRRHVPTTIEFSTDSRWYWLTRTKAGIATVMRLSSASRRHGDHGPDALLRDGGEFERVRHSRARHPTPGIMWMVPPNFSKLASSACAGYPVCLGPREIARLGNVDLFESTSAAPLIVTCVMGFLRNLRPAKRATDSTDGLLR